MCSNDAAAARTLMKDFNPVMGEDLGGGAPQVMTLCTSHLTPHTSHLTPHTPQVLIDWWLMTQGDAVAISNSSFAFAACMLNDR